MNKALITTSLQVIIILVALYLATTKALEVGFTHDESYSYLHFTKDSFIDIISLKHAFTNNHIINTLGMKYSEALFGNSEISLRLPNLMALLFYCMFSVLCLKEQSNTIRFSGIVMLIFVVPLFDFFSMARGYGLSFCFFMGMTHFSFQVLKTPTKWAYTILFHIFGTLAVMSHAVVVSAYASMFLVLATMIYSRREVERQKALTRLTAPVVLSIILLYEPLRRLGGGEHQFTFGGKNSIYESTLTSLAQDLFYGLPATPTTNFLALLVIVILIGTPLVFYFRKLEAKISFDTAIFLPTSLVGIIIILACLNIGFNVDYPIGRLALFLIPLTLLAIIIAIAQFKQYFSYILVPMAMLQFASFTSHRKTDRFPEWDYDRHTPEMLEVLKKNVSDGQVNLVIDWVFEPTINYYRVSRDYEWLEPVNRNGISTENGDWAYGFEQTFKTEDLKFTTISAYSQPETRLVRLNEASDR